MQKKGLANPAQVPPGGRFYVQFHIHKWYKELVQGERLLTRGRMKPSFPSLN